MEYLAEELHGALPVDNCRLERCSEGHGRLAHPCRSPHSVTFPGVRSHRVTGRASFSTGDIHRPIQQMNKDEYRRSFSFAGPSGAALGSSVLSLEGMDCGVLCRQV